MYPRSESERVRWWTNTISYSRKRQKTRFEAGRVLRDQYYNDAATERERSYEQYGSENVTARTRCSLIFGWIDQSIANLLDRHPIFKCYPETPEAAAKIDPADPHSLSLAEGTSKIVNYRYRETNQLRVEERVVLDAFLTPYGAAKIGYTIDLDKRFQDLFQPEEGLVLDNPAEENLFLGVGTETLVEETQDHRLHIHEHVTMLQTPGAMRPEFAELVERHIRLHKAFLQRRAPSANTNVRFEAPFAVWWPSDMFLTDVFSMEGVQDARWIAFGWELPLEEVQADPSYENVRDLEPSRWEDAPETTEDGGDGLDVVRGWEIWARNFPVGKGVFRDVLAVVAEGHDKFLRYEEEWPYTNLDDYPAETLVFNSGFRSWYYKSPLLMGGADTVQALVNEILDGYLSIVRRQKNVWLCDPSTGLTSERIQEVLGAPDCSIVEVPGLAESANRAVIPLPFHDVPPEKGELLAVIQNLLDRSLGTPQPIALPKVDTATEASIMERRNTSRENRRVMLLSEFQVRKARKMWQLDTQYMPDKSFLIDRNAQLFLQISPEMARGEYLFTIDVSSHSTSVAVERSQWMDLLNLFAGLTPIMIQTYGLPPNLPELARRLLVRGFSERAVEEILPMLEMAARKMQAEQEAALAQGAVEQGRGEKQGIGPLIPSEFNRDLPREGSTAGAQETPK